jgi:hypothetical protein
VSRDTEGGSTELVKPRCLDWLWLRGQGFLQAPWRGYSKDKLCNYLEEVILGELADPGIWPPMPFFVTGGTAGEREDKRPGSGDFLLAAGDGTQSLFRIWLPG